MRVVLALLVFSGKAFAAMQLFATLCTTDYDSWAKPYQSAGLVGNYVVTSSISQPQGTFGPTYLVSFASNPVVQSWNCSGSTCVSQGLVCSSSRSTCAQPTDYKSSLDPAVPKPNSNNERIQDTLYSNNSLMMFVDYFSYCAGSTSFIMAMQLNGTGYLTHGRVNPSPSNYNDVYLGVNCLSALSRWSYSTGSATWSKVTATNIKMALGTNRVYSFPTPQMNSASGPRPTYFCYYFLVHDQYRVHYLVPQYTGFTTTGMAPFMVAHKDDRTVALVTGDQTSGTWSWYATLGLIPDPLGSTYVGNYAAYRAASPYSDFLLYTDDSGQIPRRESFAFATTVPCLAVGRPSGGSADSTFLYGSVYIYCASGSTYTIRVPRFTVAGASGFGWAVKFARADTVLAVSAPSSGKVYLFSFDPSTRTLSTTPFETYSSPIGYSTGYGQIIDLNDNMMTVVAPSTSTCAAASSQSGTVYIYTNTTDCRVSDWVPYGPCSVTCGSGAQAANRTITRPAAFGGEPCPSLTGFVSCEAGPCPIDCVVRTSTCLSGTACFSVLILCVNAGERLGAERNLQRDMRRWLRERDTHHSRRATIWRSRVPFSLPD